MKKYIVITFFLFSSFLFSQPFSIDNAVSMAYSNNISIAILKNKILQGKNNITSACRWFQNNPNISIGATFDLKWNATASLPIEIKGQQYYRRKKAQASLKIAQLNLRKKKIYLKYDIYRNYVHGVVLQNKIEVLQYLLKIEKELENILRNQKQNGEISNIDYDSLRIEIALDNNQLQNIQTELKINIFKLENFLNYQFKTNTPFVYSLPNIALSNTNNNITNNIDIQRRMVQIQISLYELKLLKSQAFFDKIAPYLSYTSDTTLEAGLEFPLPIFNLKTSEIKAKKLAYNTLKLEKQQDEKKFLQQLKIQYTLFKKLKNQKEFYTHSILPTSEYTIEEVKKYYEIGDIGLPSLKTYWEQWLNLKMNYWDSLEKYYNVILEIKKIKGVKF